MISGSLLAVGAVVEVYSRHGRANPPTMTLPGGAPGMPCLRYRRGHKDRGGESPDQRTPLLLNRTDTVALLSRIEAARLRALVHAQVLLI